MIKDIEQVDTARVIITLNNGIVLDVQANADGLMIDRSIESSSDELTTIYSEDF